MATPEVMTVATFERGAKTSEELAHTAEICMLRPYGHVFMIVTHENVEFVMCDNGDNVLDRKTIPIASVDSHLVAPSTEETKPNG